MFVLILCLASVESSGILKPTMILVCIYFVDPWVSKCSNFETPRGWLSLLLLLAFSYIVFFLSFSCLVYQVTGILMV